LRVRAELDEHNAGKVKVGEAVTVRAEAFRGQTFAGKVAAIAPLVQPARLNSPGIAQSYRFQHQRGDDRSERTRSAHRRNER